MSMIRMLIFIALNRAGTPTSSDQPLGVAA